MKKSSRNSFVRLGQLIQQERKNRKLTQTELGHLTETSINFISQIESGKSTAHIGKVFHVLQILGLELVCQRGSRGLILPETPTPVLKQSGRAR